MGLGPGPLQVRLHRNIAASSLVADCNIPQRPPADTDAVENPMKFYFYTEGTHTHMYIKFAAFCNRVFGNRRPEVQRR